MKINRKKHAYAPERIGEIGTHKDADCLRCRKGSEFYQSEDGKKCKERSCFTSKPEDIGFVED